MTTRSRNDNSVRIGSKGKILRRCLNDSMDDAETTLSNIQDLAAATRKTKLNYTELTLHGKISKMNLLRWNAFQRHLCFSVSCIICLYFFFVISFFNFECVL